MSTRAQTKGRVEHFHIGMKLARKDIKKWTQKQLAFMASEVAKRQTGDPNASVSFGMVALIELGERNPSLEMAGWLAEALGYEISDLGVLREVVTEQVAS